MPLNQNRMAVRIPAQRGARLDSAGMHRLLRPYFCGLQKEHLWRIDLDARSGLLGAELVSIGTVDFTLAHPREIFRNAFVAGASRIALAHNHISGNLRPSPQDLEVFERLELCALILGVAVVEQLIVHDDRFYSWRDSRRSSSRRVM